MGRRAGVDRQGARQAAGTVHLRHEQRQPDGGPGGLRRRPELRGSVPRDLPPPPRPDRLPGEGHPGTGSECAAGSVLSLPGLLRLLRQERREAGHPQFHRSRPLPSRRGTRGDGGRRRLRRTRLFPDELRDGRRQHKGSTSSNQGRTLKAGMRTEKQIVRKYRQKLYNHDC